MTPACLVLAGVGAAEPASPEENRAVWVPRLAGEYVNVYQPAGDVFPGPSTEELEAGKFYEDWVPNDRCFARD